MPKRCQNGVFLPLFLSYKIFEGVSGPDFCFFEKIQLKSFQRRCFFRGAPHVRGTKKLRPINCDPKMTPCWHAFLEASLRKGWKKCHMSPTAKGVKNAFLKQSVANLSKEAKIRTWGHRGRRARPKPVKRRFAPLASKTVFLPNQVDFGHGHLSGSRLIWKRFKYSFCLLDRSENLPWEKSFGLQGH